MRMIELKDSSHWPFWVYKAVWIRKLYKDGIPVICWVLDCEVYGHWTEQQSNHSIKR